MPASARRVPLNALATFREVAKTQNLRAAAEALNLTHSAVSQQIRNLETQLDFVLFDRRGRRIVLNAAGEALLRSVEAALVEIDAGVHAAAAAAGGAAQRLRVTALPSFTQRWLLPRMGRWRERHPDIALEIDASQHAVDLQREGFHAALRQGRGPWPGLESELLVGEPMPLVVVGSPSAARRLLGAAPEAFAREPLLGDRDLWERWFAAAGFRTPANPVAVFNDMGMMLQAAEQSLGLAMTREILAADALEDGRLVRLSPLAITHDQAHPYHLVYPPGLRDWAPLAALRRWLRDEIARSQKALHPPLPTAKTRRRASTPRGPLSDRAGRPPELR